MINIDENWHDCCTIDTETFLEATLGEQLESSDDIFSSVVIEPGQWLMEVDALLQGAIMLAEGQAYSRTQVYNTYNEENDLSDVIQFCIFYPSDEGDWIWANDCYVAIEPHLGGDVRGNYGATRLYKVDCLGDSGFFDTQLGWYAEPLSDFSEYNKTTVDLPFGWLAYNDKLDNLLEQETDHEQIETINERCSIGYAQSPTYELEQYLDSTPEYSPELKCYVASLPGGALVKLHPECNLPR